MKLSLGFSPIAGQRMRLLPSLIVAIAAIALWAAPAQAFHGGSHSGTFRTWETTTATASDSNALDADQPQETLDDAGNATGHLGAGPVNVTAVPSLRTGSGLLYWNPATDGFKAYKVSGTNGLGNVDVNRGAASPGAPVLGGGDVWGVVDTIDFDVFVHFRGTDQFRGWDTGSAGLSGVRVNPTTGKVYFGTDNQIAELDPVANSVRKWTIGNFPLNLMIDATGNVWASGENSPFLNQNQIVRLDPTTGTVTRWDLPNSGFFSNQPRTPRNYIIRDDDGQVWVTETASNQVGHLDPATNVFEQFTKSGGTNAPAGIAATGTGSAKQAYFNQSDFANRVSVLTLSAASPSTTTVTPTSAVVAPTANIATPTDFTISPLTATIPATTAGSTSFDPTGIDAFPVPAGTDTPNGLTRVAFTQTVFGSLESDFVSGAHVFEFMSSIGPSTPEAAGRATGSGFYGTPKGAVSFHMSIQRKDAGGAVTGSLDYRNDNTGEKVKSTSITRFVVIDTDNNGDFDRAEISGNCTNNGFQCTFDAVAQDNGNSGKTDTFSISGLGLVPTNGTLEGGNIRVE
jgi:hypothetical protein